MKLAELRIRDPFVYNDGDRMILYGSMHSHTQTSFVFSASADMENWSELMPIFEPDADFWGTRDFWAPEMHAYGGAYYLFASFIRDGLKRGTAILRAQSPLGPFKPHGDARATPDDWQCLDGTLYVEGGKPYMVFCHEWVECIDGEMCAVPLRDDLSGADGAPTVLFRASEAPWCVPLKGDRLSIPAGAKAYVTDGPFLFNSRDGGLCMLWSSFSVGGYTVGLARSEGGVLGPWRQQATPVYALDGGHCMLFKDLRGELRMSLHQPNTAPLERARFLRAEITDTGIQLLR